MLNFNGTILYKDSKLLTGINRAFKYGDGIFETLKMTDSKIIFLEDHYFRLLASMRMLRMEIPPFFTADFLCSEIQKTAIANRFDNARIRINVFRKEGGLYRPLSNEIEYLIECEELKVEIKEIYVADVFKDYFVNTDFLSTIKTTNRIINVLSSIYAAENQLDNCILLNEKKHVAEAINGNVFIVTGSLIKTPALSEGCINGIIRKKIIEIVSKEIDLQIEETSISPFELLKSDEMFITNSVVGIQAVSNYKKRKYTSEISNKLANKLSELI